MTNSFMAQIEEQNRALRQLGTWALGALRAHNETSDGPSAQIVVDMLIEEANRLGMSLVSGDPILKTTTI